jgi:hypothetical protein
MKNPSGERGQPYGSLMKNAFFKDDFTLNIHSFMAQEKGSSGLL